MVTTFFIAGGSIALSYYAACFMITGDVRNGWIGVFFGALMAGLAIVRNLFGVRD